MSILNLFNKGTQDVATNVLAANILKRAKTPEQCTCIDFFYGVEDTTKKKGGCFKKNTAWTIDDYIAYVDKKVESLNLKQRAIEKIGLDESQISEIPPIVLSSFVRSGEGLRWKFNSNYTRYVTNKFTVTWIFFSATQIYTHTYVFDTMTDNTEETTRDFFYSDITCIRTEHEVEEFVYEVQTKGGCFKKPESKFDHYHRHWDTLQITVPNDSYYFCCRTTDTLEQSIQAAKAMIREKKQA